MKITFGQMRTMGLSGILVFCHCGHHIALDGAQCRDEVRLSDIEPRSFVRAAAPAALMFGPTLSEVIQRWRS